MADSVTLEFELTERSVDAVLDLRRQRTNGLFIAGFGAVLGVALIAFGTVSPRGVLAAAGAFLLIMAALVGWLWGVQVPKVAEPVPVVVLDLAAVEVDLAEHQVASEKVLNHEGRRPALAASGIVRMPLVHISRVAGLGTPTRAHGTLDVAQALHRHDLDDGSGHRQPPPPRLPAAAALRSAHAQHERPRVRAAGP